MSTNATIGTSSMFLIAAAAAAAAATSVVYASAFGASKPRAGGSRKIGGGNAAKHHHFDVPPEILEDGGCECKDEVILAVRLALEAGENMTQHYHTKGTADENIDDLGISTKSHESDFATAIDVKNENFITAGIKSQFPDHEIIGEETTGTGAIPPLTHKPTWIIDPIDGTTNFASGLPLSCVSIGFCLEGKPYMGVVYAPMTNELYVAVKGRGAYRNGIRLSGCTGEKAGKTLSKAVVCFEFGYARTQDGIDNMVNAVRRLLEHGVRTTRTLGSGVLDLCYVACGRMDVVYTGMAEEGWKPWDYCAGLVVAVEAGCTMSHLKLDGENDFDADGTMKENWQYNLYSRSMICGVNPILVEQCRDVVLNASSKKGFV
mmetsp:Transcript_17504/g.36567  ORF Transcript_17504/g.36567 Transcript_17504/m.36567 type:complete len:375 (+) Transcript_17504:53-1177(+)